LTLTIALRFLLTSALQAAPEQSGDGNCAEAACQETGREYNITML